MKFSRYSTKCGVILACSLLMQFVPTALMAGDCAYEEGAPYNGCINSISASNVTGGSSVYLYVSASIVDDSGTCNGVETTSLSSSSNCDQTMTFTSNDLSGEEVFTKPMYQEGYNYVNFYVSSVSEGVVCMPHNLTETGCDNLDQQAYLIEDDAYRLTFTCQEGDDKGRNSDLGVNLTVQLSKA